MSGVSVFDFLTMVVPGGLILAMGANFFGEIPLVIDLCEKCKFSGYIVILVSSYLLGLINNSFMDFMFKWFRNNPFYIQIQYMRIYNTLPNKGVLGQLNMLSDIIKIERGKSITESLRSLICSFKTMIYKTFEFKSYEDRNKILTGYYKAYYFVAANQINSSISTFESTVTAQIEELSEQISKTQEQHRYNLTLESELADNSQLTVPAYYRVRY